MHCKRKWTMAAVLVAAVAGCQDGDDGDDGIASDTDTDGTGESDGAGTEGAETDGTRMYGSFEERPCPEENFLTYENFGGPYMLNYCTGCHAVAIPQDMRQMAPTTVNLDTVLDVRALAPRVWVRAADTNSTMPPAGAPGLDERTLLGEWLACGAPTNADLGM